MNPLRLSARNYRSFETLDLDFPTGAVAVVGPNGAGKSSLVNAIDLALFGARSLSEFLSEDAGDEEMVIALEFEHRGITYRIRRTYSAKGRGKTSLDFEWWEDNGGEAHAGWLPLTLETAAATQARIEETIGLSQDVFRASVFLAQGQGALFTEAQPRDRKAILAEVLDLSVWESLLDKARQDATAIRATTDRLGVQIEEGERELERKRSVELTLGNAEHVVGKTELRLRETEAAHGQATTRLSASREVAAKLTAAREVLASRERELATANERHRQITQTLTEAEGLPKLRAESEALAGRRESLERDLAAAREGEKAREELRRLRAEHDRLDNESRQLQFQATALRDKARATGVEAEFSICDRCGQELAHDAAKRAIESYEAEADALVAQAKEKDEARWALLPDIERASPLAASGPNAAKQAELENALRLANEAERTLASIAEREKVVEALAVEFAQLEVRLPELTRARDEAQLEFNSNSAQAPSEDLEAAVARAAGDLQEARADAEAAKSRLAVAEAELRRLAAVELRVKENRAALAGQQAELERLALCEQAYGRNGIPVYVLENVALPFLENEVNAIVAELGTPYHVELRTQKERKSGDGLKEELYILVDNREYGTYSGGERSRLNLAFSRALARLLRSRGVDIDLLVMDEPDGLDAAGFAALAESLKGALADFSSILTISHHPELATAFDQTLTVVKEDGRSRVEGANDRAEVTA